MAGSSEVPSNSEEYKGPHQPYVSDEIQRTPSPSQYHRNLEDIDEKEALKEKGPSHSVDSNTLSAPDSFDNDPKSQSFDRAEASRLDDDLELLRAERLISHQERDDEMHQPRSRTFNRHDTELEDTFNPPAEETVKTIKRKDETAALYKFWLFLRKFPRFVRYFVYYLPGAILLLIPILLGALAIDQKTNPVGGVGGTYLTWFGIWLQIVWGSLWASRMITHLMPHIFHSLAKVSGSTNPKKWKDIGAQLEIHTALFLWLLAVLVSFKPTCDGHRVAVPPGREEDVDVQWINIVFKVIIALFVLAALNFIEKILIQWIATAFHERTYATRIENNKGDIRQLVQLFEHAKAHLEDTDSFWQGNGESSASGTQTPMQIMHENAQKVLGKVGAVAGKVGNDFIGRKVDANHPSKVVAELLRTTSSAHSLARLIYRSLVEDDKEMVLLDDMKQAYTTEEEAKVAFNIFDKDLNGDISMEELEASCNDIALEKKAIAASLKDLDSVIQKLDKVFLFIIVIITVIVFISIISGSAAAGLASAGSSVLGLAWMLQATAQEFLQSIIFVFIKHPFDVGDRVTVYGSTGANLAGDDYYVTEISLLYTEFKKLEGHIVQAPNSLLNTLFILNQRRSNFLADPVKLKIRFGTPGWMIEELKARMIEFCLDNKRDFQSNILTELSGIEEQRAAAVTVVFFHKSNFQNELIRLTRHSKFMTELMAQMVNIGIQAPLRMEPGGSRDNPMYWAGMQPPPYRPSDQFYDPNAPAVEATPTAQYASQGPHSPLARASSNTTHRSGTIRNRHLPSIDTNLNNSFQDVYGDRREQVVASRLASIREKDRAAKIHKEAEQDRERLSESEPRASASGLAPIQSMDSASRSRTFMRPRSKSKSQQPNEMV